MHQTELHLRLWIDGFNGFGEALQAIHAGDENIFDAPGHQLRDDRKPKLRARVFRGPQAEHFFGSCQIDADGEVNRLI